ncbi:MAG: recombination protein RecR [Bacteroidetes bacterium CG2_30_33_31]|nr:MAG: recombination protein RecR [Bacteroidetes bacterium CG2_30_33_31]
MNQFSSRHLDRAVGELAKLPGIGKKTALRLALHLLRQQEFEVESLSSSLLKMHQEIKFCKRCHNISDGEICSICSNSKRNNGQLCIVEGINDVIAIEKTDEYFGLFHVLGGVISPMDGVGPQDIYINTLEDRIIKENISEIIMALPTTIEGDTTIFYLAKKLAPYNIKITAIARGVGVGDELEYIDEVTLGRSIVNRLPYNSNAKIK